MTKINSNSTLRSAEINPITKPNEGFEHVYVSLIAMFLTGLHCQSPSQEEGDSNPSHSTIVWPEGAPQEKMTPIVCPRKLCMFVEEDSEYCSVDPSHFEEGIIFFGKSRLRVQSGTDPLTWGQTIPPIGLTLTTPRGSLPLAPHLPLVPIESKGISDKEGAWRQLS